MKEDLVRGLALLLTLHVIARARSDHEIDKRGGSMRSADTHVIFVSTITNSLSGPIDTDARGNRSNESTTADAVRLYNPQPPPNYVHIASVSADVSGMKEPSTPLHGHINGVVGLRVHKETSVFRRKLFFTFTNLAIAISSG
ncbi:hypothetical protein BDV19DRAFT_215923 [Aspergillus venezuelensis]